MFLARSKTFLQKYIIEFSNIYVAPRNNHQTLVYIMLYDRVEYISGVMVNTFA